jgi:hypothetical protein
MATFRGSRSGGSFGEQELVVVGSVVGKMQGLGEDVLETLPSRLRIWLYSAESLHSGSILWLRGS